MELLQRMAVGVISGCRAFATGPASLVMIDLGSRLVVPLPTHSANLWIGKNILAVVDRPAQVTSIGRTM